MSQPETRALLSFALELADAADEISLGYYRGSLGVQEKADGSLVTIADRAIEGLLRERIGERFPDHAILGEEEGLKPGAGHGRWIIDPIDGTHGFARAMPIWATLIAFEREGRVEVGIASAPALGARWWAGRGFGAYRADLPAAGHGGTRIAVSAVDHLDESQLLYGSYSLTVDAWPGTDALLRRAWRTRGVGDFWGHCLVADGSAEAMLEGEIAPWDIAALIVIVEEAGGRLTDGQGTPRIDGGHSVTSNGAVHEELLGALGPHRSVSV